MMPQAQKNAQVAALIAAAGNGLRMVSNTGRKKQFRLLATKPVLVHSLEKFENSPSIDTIVLVVPADEIAYVRKEIVESYDLGKVKAIVPGGKARQDSVANGLRYLASDTEIVVIHDGVRPFLTEEMIQDSIKGAYEWGACVVGVKSSDTIKEVQKEGMVKQTLDRDLLWLIQTPQAFRVSLIKESFFEAQKCGFYGTDEASLVERLGYPIKIIKGSTLNIKITTPEDFELAEAILKQSLIRK